MSSHTFPPADGEIFITPYESSPQHHAATPQSTMPPSSSEQASSESSEPSDPPEPPSSKASPSSDWRAIFTQWPHRQDMPHQEGKPNDPVRKEIVDQIYHEAWHIQKLHLAEAPVKTLVFRGCIFQGPFWLTQCRFEALELHFENCIFKQGWDGGTRGRGDQSSVYRSLRFHDCQLEGDINLTDSTVEDLQISSCRSNNGRLLLRRGKFKQGMIEKSQWQTLDAESFRLTRTLTLKNTQIDQVLFTDISEPNNASFLSSEEPSAAVHPCISIEEGCKINDLKCQQTHWPSVTLSIKASVVTSLWTGYKVFQSQTKPSTLGRLEIHNSQMQHINSNRTTWTRGISLQNIEQLTSFLLNKADVQGDFVWLGCDSHPALQWDEAKFKGSVSLKNVRCAKFSAWGLHILLSSTQQHKLYCKQLHVAQDCVWNKSIIEIPATWEQCTFAQLASFEETSWQQGATFGGAGKASKSVEFGGSAKFKGAVFVQAANFRGSSFAQEADFENAAFRASGKANSNSFSHCTFLGEAIFKDIQLWGNLEFSPQQNSGSQNAAVFHRDLVCELQAPDPGTKPPTVELWCNHVTFHQQATFSVQGHKTTLHLRRTQANHLQIGGNYHLINLHRAVITGQSEQPLFRDMTSGSIRLHGSRLEHQKLVFTEPGHLNAKERIKLFARDATFDRVVFTGYFRGEWNTLGCDFRNVRWNELTLDADMNLTGSTIQQDPEVVAFSSVRFRHNPLRKKDPKRWRELSLQRSDYLEHLQFADNCELGILNLRGSSLHSLTMRNGRCEFLLARRDLHNKTITLYLDESSYPALCDAYARTHRIQKLPLIPDKQTPKSPIFEQYAPHIDKEHWRSWLENSLQTLFSDATKQEQATTNVPEDSASKQPSIRVVLEKPTSGPSNKASASTRTASAETTETNNSAHTQPEESDIEVEEASDFSHGKENAEIIHDIEETDSSGASTSTLTKPKSRFTSFDGKQTPFSGGEKPQVEYFSSRSTDTLVHDLAASVKAKHEEQRQSHTESSFSTDTKETTAGTMSGQKTTPPSLEEGDDIFCIKMSNSDDDTDTENKDTENKNTEEPKWAEIDIRQHVANPLPFLQRELKHFYRSTEILGWSISEFIINGSDNISTPWTKPVFRDVSVEGATIKGKLFDSAIIEGTFRAESACTFNSASFRQTEFRGPVLLTNCTILSFLNVQEAQFLSPMSLVHLRCHGAMQFQRAKFRDECYFSQNQVTDRWYLNQSEFTGPVLWEKEDQSGGLECLKTEFNGKVQIRNCVWTGDIMLEQAFFAQECLFHDVKARSLHTIPPHLCSPSKMMSSSTLADPALTKVTQFKGSLFLRNLRLEHHLSWMFTRFADTLVLEDVDVGGEVRMVGCECSRDVIIQHLGAIAVLLIARSSFSERLVIEETSRIHNIELERSLCYGPLVIRGTLSPQDILASQELVENDLCTLQVSEMRCLDDVSLENLAVQHFITIENSLFSSNVLLHHIRFYLDSVATHPRQLRPHRMGSFGGIEFSETKIYNQLSIQDIHQAGVFLQATQIRQELDVSSFSDPPLYCSLGKATVGHISFPNDPVNSIRFAQIVGVEETHRNTASASSSSTTDSLLPSYPVLANREQLSHAMHVQLCQQKAQHYAQLYQLCIQRKQFLDAREFRYQYRKALKDIPFWERFDYLHDIRIHEEDHGTTEQHTTRKARSSSPWRRLPANATFPTTPVHTSAVAQMSYPTPDVPAHRSDKPVLSRLYHRAAAFSESIIIQAGELYDSYGRTPAKLLLWLMVFNTLFSLTYGFYGWGWDTIAIVWADALLTPIGLVLQGLGLAPFGTKLPTLWLKGYFAIHATFLGLIWLNFISLLFPGLLSQDRLSKMLARRTGTSSS